MISTDDAGLVRMLLASATGRHRDTYGDAQLLELLIKKAPKGSVIRRSRVLFEALNVLNLENPHSDFLAWLLDPLGPLSNQWLLQSIFKQIRPEMEWPGNPIVEREVDIDTGRLDILITWDSFQLIIENKVWSTEGDRQIDRYLESTGLSRPDAGCIVYLTPNGDWPASVDAGNPCVAAMS